MLMEKFQFIKNSRTNELSTLELSYFTFLILAKLYL